MINIKNKQDCCGCSACAQRCPKQCISMQMDNEGFLYPQVDSSKCVDCHLCEKVCPVINQDEARNPLNIYAAKNSDDEIRLQSSSGGIFTMLAESTIDQGGVVFGACWDKEWNVKHDYVDKISDLQKFRSSKYLQSVIDDNYLKAEQFLKTGRKVMFSGTPCQVAGLKLFLRKEYENLLTLEIACHGVPSPKVWHNYLTELIDLNKISIIKSINFRDKKYGWNGYHFSATYINKNGKTVNMSMPHGDNSFYRGFLNHLYVRPSCYQCPAKSGRSQADITIADFWGIDKLYPSLDDNKGYSIVCANTDKGLSYVLDLCDTTYEVPYYEVVKYNPALIKSIKENALSNKFWQSDAGVIKTVERLCGDSFILKLKKKISLLLHKPIIYK